MPIDIDALSEPELVDLNHRIVERLRFLHQIHAHQAMLKFSIGDRVTFEDEQRRKVEGTLTRYNRKSVTVIGADGRHWNIAPGFLRKADHASASKPPNIIPRAHHLSRHFRRKTFRLASISCRVLA